MAGRIALPAHNPVRRRTRDASVVRAYWEIWSGLPCEYGLLHGELCPGQELNHILCGSSKEDAFWNLFVMCHRHHQDPVVGFHGRESRSMKAEILTAKLEQGFILPREAYRYLPCGVDGAPTTPMDEVHNQMIVEARAEVVRARFA